MDASLRALRREYISSPTDELLSRVTLLALRAKQGYFAAWQGGHGHIPGSHTIEIEQKIPEVDPGSVKSIKTPTIKQAFQVIALDGLDDLAQWLSRLPSGLLSLPSQTLTLFDQPKPQTYHPEFVEPGDAIYEQPIYDCNWLETGVVQMNYFQIPLGGKRADGSLKTQVETNMAQGGSLHYPQHFIVTGFSVIPDVSASFEDTAKMLDTAWFRFFIGTMDRLVLPLKQAGIASAKTSAVGCFRLPTSIRPIYRLLSPYELIPQQNFRVEINFCTPQTFEGRFKVYTILHGFFIRRVR